MEQAPNKLYVFLICVVLALATIIAFEPLRHNGFVHFDDDEYVTENPHVQAGITLESVIWAFTTPHGGISYWHPLTWLSHMLDCQLFGLNPLWHHMTSLFFHIVNALLLFWISKRMTGAVWPSAFVAAAFALHPLHVESVAWVAERKDVLGGFFWMLTIAAYIRYAQTPRAATYLMVILALCLGLMAKPTVVTLPFVLLLLDYWPLERFPCPKENGTTILPPSESANVNYQRPLALRLIVEKIPLFALVAVLGVVTFIVQRNVGAMVSNTPLSLRISNALVSYISYIGKMFYPSRLAVLYPHPTNKLPLWQPIASFLVLAAITVSVIYAARRRRYLAVGWLWYLGTLVPVIGLVQVGLQAMADRYTYVPLIGLFIIIAWGTAELLAGWRYRRMALLILVGIVLAAMVVCTRRQVRYWQNDFTLYKHALAVTENNTVVHINLGIEFAIHDRFDEAIEEFRQVLRLNPDWVGTMNKLAWLLATSKEAKYYNPEEAIQLAERACELTSYKQLEALDTLAVAYAAAGKFDQAIEAAEKALQLAQSSGRKQLTEEIRIRLRLYKAGQPYIKFLPKAPSD